MHVAFLCYLQGIFRMKAQERGILHFFFPLQRYMKQVIILSRLVEKLDISIMVVVTTQFDALEIDIEKMGVF